jgi:hypothetical protein
MDENASNNKIIGAALRLMHKTDHSVIHLARARPRCGYLADQGAAENRASHRTGLEWSPSTGYGSKCYPPNISLKIHGTSRLGLYCLPQLPLMATVVLLHRGASRYSLSFPSRLGEL